MGDSGTLPFDCLIRPGICGADTLKIGTRGDRFQPLLAVLSARNAVEDSGDLSP